MSSQNIGASQCIELFKGLVIKLGGGGVEKLGEGHPFNAWKKGVGQGQSCTKKGTDIAFCVNILG